jgi:hypothetical protein
MEIWKNIKTRAALDNRIERRAWKQFCVVRTGGEGEKLIFAETQSRPVGLRKGKEREMGEKNVCIITGPYIIRYK